MLKLDVTNAEDLQEALVDASHVQPTVAVVWAAWCGPCRSLKPKLEALALKHNFPLVRIDGGTHADLARHLKVRAVPTVIVYRRGQEITRFSGDKSESDLAIALGKVGTFQQPLQV